MDQQSPVLDETNPARRIISRFGGIRPMATKTGIAATTIQYWWDTGVISAKRQPEVMAAGKRKGIPVAPADFFDGGA